MGGLLQILGFDKMTDVKEIIDESMLEGILDRTKNPSDVKVRGILDKALEKRGLDLEDIGWLVNSDGKNHIEMMFDAAGKIKREIYGERLVLFAPLYLSNHCVNNCEYCGFRTGVSLPRKKLSMDEIRSQVRVLEDMGHKRLLLEFGEHPEENDIDYVVDVIKTIYGTKSGKGEIRRVNVNIASTSVEDYKKLKEAGIGTYQLFQETYHRKTYESIHNGPKADYERQLLAHDRAFEAGIDDIGLGVLFSLYDYRFEVLGLVSHAQYLERKYGVGPHTFSVPRWQKARGLSWEPEHPVSEKELLKVIAILRLAVPYTGMIISTRESPETRKKAFEIGISQTSAASRTSPGGYGEALELSQFSLSDHRSVSEVIESILKQDLVPSFCTACYRTGRTGEAFMEIAKPGDIQRLCRPNALLTLKEYLEDYASEGVKRLGEKVLDKYLRKIPGDRRAETESRLKRIESGERDIYF